MLPPVVPLVVQQCVAVVAFSWLGFVGLTGLKTAVSRRAEEKEEQTVAASQKLGAAGANFVLAIASYATVLVFAFIQKDNVCPNLHDHQVQRRRPCTGTPACRQPSGAARRCTAPHRHLQAPPLHWYDSSHDPDS